MVLDQTAVAYLLSVYGRQIWETINVLPNGCLVIDEILLKASGGVQQFTLAMRMRTLQLTLYVHGSLWVDRVKYSLCLNSRSQINCILS